MRLVEQKKMTNAVYIQNVAYFYHFNDWFKDPIDNGKEYGTPYQIVGSWREIYECSYCEKNE